MNKKQIIITLFFLMIFSNHPLSARHPLITDDTGTQGLGGIEIEIAGEYGYDKEGNEKEYSTQAGLSLSAGIYKSIDIVLGLPYQLVKSKSSGPDTFEHGIGDMACEIKWRFIETGPFALAVKPGLILPVGNESKDLGAGKLGYTAYLIGTFEMEPLAVHLNGGYIRNNNKHDERENLWHASLAAEYEISESFTGIANIGCERNSDRDDKSIPAFLLGGCVYTINDLCDIDAGLKWGFTNPETDITVLAGVTIHFATIKSDNDQNKGE